MTNYDENTHAIITVDVGGSHLTSAICLEYQQIDEVTYMRKEFSSKASADVILDSWCNCIAHTIASSQATAAGIAFAMPGPFDYEEGICYIKGLNKYEALYGMNIKEALSARLGIAESKFRFRNDAEATIAGEVAFGAGIGRSRVLGVTLGTGFGSAFFDGETTKDINLGSEPFRDSIADDHLSTRWFLRRYHELTGLNAGGVKELALLAETQSTPREIFKEFAEGFVEFISLYIDRFRPETIVLCGNIAKAWKHFLPVIQRKINVPVVISTLGENAALIGAASLFNNADATISEVAK